MLLPGGHPGHCKVFTWILGGGGGIQAPHPHEGLTVAASFRYYSLEVEVPTVGDRFVVISHRRPEPGPGAGEIPPHYLCEAHFFLVHLFIWGVSLHGSRLS